MKYLPFFVLLTVILACSEKRQVASNTSQPTAASPTKPTPDLLASRQLYCDLFAEQFQKYSLSFELEGTNRDVMTIKHRDKAMLLMADAMMFSKPELMNQLKEREFKSVRFTDEKKYSRIVPVE